MNPNLTDGIPFCSSRYLSSIDLRFRFLASLFFSFSVSFYSTLPGVFLAFALVVFFGIAFCAFSPSVFSRLKNLNLFCLSVIILLPPFYPGAPAFSFFWLHWSLSGLAFALLIALKANTVFLAFLLLVGSSDSAALATALRHLGVPEKLVQIFFFMIRYLDVIEQEYHRLETSLRARCFVPRFNWHTFKTLGELISLLFLGSLRRAHRVQMAMRCRGFVGRFVALPAAAATMRDYLFVLISLIITAGLTFFESG